MSLSLQENRRFFGRFHFMSCLASYIWSQKIEEQRMHPHSLWQKNAYYRTGGSTEITKTAKVCTQHCAQRLQPGLFRSPTRCLQKRKTDSMWIRKDFLGDFGGGFFRFFKWECCASGKILYHGYYVRLLYMLFFIYFVVLYVVSYHRFQITWYHAMLSCDMMLVCWILVYCVLCCVILYYSTRMYHYALFIC